ncbi:MAG: hypothetical protein ACE5FQ_12885 [Thiogranum sp.]
MSEDRENDFTGKVRRVLDSHADALDERTVARLQAMRRAALARPVRPGIGWLPATGMAVAAAALVAVLVWNQMPGGSNGLPGDEELLSQMENLELLEELDFYAWLEATQSSS